MKNEKETVLYRDQQTRTPSRLRVLLPGMLGVAVALSGCAAANSMMGGNTRKAAIAEVSWDFAKDAVMIEVAAQPDLNQYGGQSHSLLVAVYQMADAAAFYKLIADPAALANSLGADKGAEPFLQLTRYVVLPGQRSILILDRAQKTRLIGIIAGYYDLSGETSARLFEVPLTVTGEGMISRTWKAGPAPLAVRLHFGADAIIEAVRLNNDPSEKKMQEAVPLDGGGKEIKLTTDSIENAVRLNQGIQKLGQ